MSKEQENKQRLQKFKLYLTITINNYKGFSPCQLDNKDITHRNKKEQKKSDLSRTINAQFITLFLC